MKRLYGWGANSHGQLGMGFVCEQVLMPTKIEDLPDVVCDSKIKHMCGGGGHSFILTSDGNLFGAGLNSSGQVGNGTQQKSVSTFEQTRGLEDQIIVDMASGWSHSLALNNKGQIWVWGSNSHGQLGLPNQEVPFSCLPIKLDLTDVVSIAAGLRHTAVATKDGHVYSWGQGTKGQLGYLDKFGEKLKLQVRPRRVDMIQSKVVQVACGQSTTYALTSEGHVLAWGDNKWGQLAHDPMNLEFFSCPLAIPLNYFAGERISWLKVGWTHCVAGVATGNVYVWGRCDYGQLGSTFDQSEDVNEESARAPPIHSRYQYIPMRLNLGGTIRQLACGSEHNVATLAEKDQISVVAWGWNEHGNCGNGSTENLISPKEIPFKENVLLIGTGSAHCFVLTDV